MDIWNALRRAGRDDITTRSVIANTVKEITQKQLWYDITIESVHIKGKKILVKTWNAVVNSELQMLEWDIKKASLKKLSTMHIKIGKDIVFRFI